ncbi:microtubule-actin cross-linking factor 1-like isoform X6 [Amphibalanus amphitrite]|uniref:microtubule-actin cross-linking factor 1-like isoform X6 n=1 Tax=Amphibalanus amphitrite TaxID=1232801 RepID=UPI001C928516|nr:microtubule-actin cross-linking factor 1-like isoform X6 [Amphibalanus amphitrite]
MSMYKFHTGGDRLFMSGGRQTDDYNAVREREDVPELQQVVTSRRMASDIHQSTSEMQRSERHGGMKSVSMRVIKKTTTLSHGQQKSRMESMMEQHDGRMIVPVRERPAIQHSSHLTQSSNYQQRQISDIVEGDDSINAKDALLRWAQRTTERYPGVRVNNFTSSWRDGLAFNAIIHRNRPDLVDWRDVQTKSARVRLDQAFHTVEQEYGVTRLLDPEDVDTPEPDEKSLITYVSSLYDIFPEPPAQHPLYDAVSAPGVSRDRPDGAAQAALSDYKDGASRLHQWIRQQTARMKELTFPASVPELRELHAQSKAFKTRDVPPKQQEMTRLLRLYQDLERSHHDLGKMDLPPEQHISLLDRNWGLMMKTYQERHALIEEEMTRMERLQRLADKIQRDIRATDRRLNDIQQTIKDESRRISKMKPRDVKMLCEKIDLDLVQVEETIKGLFSDVNSLQEGRHPQGPELYHNVQQLHNKWMSVHNNMQENLLGPLSKRMNEDPDAMFNRLIKTDENFRFLHECLEWVREKLHSIQEAEYGHDLHSCQQELETHGKEHKIIDQFQVNLDRCVAAKNNYDHEELAMYMKILSQLQKTYADLLSTSNKRLSDLMILHDFIQGATNELIWLNEKEETEVHRDWSNRNQNLQKVEAHYEHVMGELERRERQFNTIQEQGGSLVAQNHPASKTVEAYLAAMQTQWSWLLQLTLCLETHLKHAQVAHKLFQNVDEMTHIIKEQDERLNTEFSQTDFTLDEGEQLLRDMQQLRDVMAGQAEVIQELEERAHQVTPQRQRREHLPGPMPVSAICSYKSANIVIQKQDKCTLLDNSNRTKWRVQTPSGQQGSVPSVCFLLPPPDQEALEAIERLKRQYEMSLILWQRKQLRMRQNMILATIKVVKSWDLQQFMAMGKDQRDAIRRALNEDAEKLIQEGDPNDSQLRRLRREIDEVNRLFDEFERLAAEANPTNQFNTKVAALETELTRVESELAEKCAAPIPRDVRDAQRLANKHKDWENRVQRHEPALDEVRNIYNSLSKRTPAMQDRLERVNTQWESIWKTSNAYIDRLKCVEVTVDGLEEATNVVSHLEAKIADYRQLPDDRDGLKSAHLGLVDLQNSLQKKQGMIEKLNIDVGKTRKTTERTRPRQRNHPDVEELEDDVTRVTKQWTNCCESVVDRLKAVDQAADLLRQYEQQEKMERQWASQMEAEARHRQQEEERLRQAVIDKFRQCDESIADFLDWMAKVERRVANQEQVQEDVPALRNQINVVKAIKDELQQQQRPLFASLDQIQDVAERGGDILSKDELRQLKDNGQELKHRYDTVSDRTDQLHRRLNACLDELTKFRGDSDAFQSWLSRAQRQLADKERLSDLSQLKASEQDCREMVHDVVAHQADLRFLTVGAQKFIDESKEHLKSLNDFRTNLPQRLAHIEPKDHQVKHEVTELSQSYQDLLGRANKLSDKLSGLGNRQREYQEALERAGRFLREVEPQVKRVVTEPVAAEPRAVQNQLDNAKSLSSNMLSQGKLLDNATGTAQQLVSALEGQISPRQAEAITRPPEELTDQYRRLSAALVDRCQELDMALVQSRGVQDGLDSLMAWLSQAEARLQALQKPASLDRDRLAEQTREQRALQADIAQHRPGVDQIQRSAQQLLQTPSNARIAKKIEDSLRDLTARFQKLADKCDERGRQLEDVAAQTENFRKRADKFDRWFVEVFELVDGQDVGKLGADAYTAKMEELSRRRDAGKPDYDATVRSGTELVSRRDVTDTKPTKDKVEEIKAQWQELQGVMEARLKEGQTRSESMNAFEKLKDEVQQWLKRMEGRIEALQPVAVDQKLLKDQSDELKPLVREHTQYAATIDKVNDLGNQYDQLVRGDRAETPSRRRSSVTPLKKASVTSHGRRSVTPLSSVRRPSYDRSSPAPSRLGRKESLNDGYLGLDDQSPIQAQLNEINHRYDMAGTRLADRQADIDSVSAELRRHLDTLRQLQQVLDRAERQLPRDAVPQSRDEADKQLAAIRALSDELYERQPALDGLKTQAGELLRRRPGAPGADLLQANLTDVVDRWSALQAKLKARQNHLKNSKQFFDTHDQLNGWLAAKEKMLTVLGPLSSDPRLVQMQSQQVAVLRDEFAAQYPTLQTLNTVGQALIEEAEPDSATANKVGDKLRKTNDKWEELISKLEDREMNLDAASGASHQFNDSLGRLQRDLQKIGDAFDDLVTERGEPQQKLKKLNQLQHQVDELRPRLAELETLGEQLCSVLTDPSAKTEVKDKLYQLGRQQTQLQKKMDNLRAELENSLKEDREFEDGCADVQDWIKDCVDRMGRPLKVSADADKLARQVAEYEPVYKTVTDREHEVFLVQRKGQELIAKTANKQEGKTLQKFLDKLQKDWDAVKKEAVGRHTRLQTCTDLCRRYHTNLEKFAPWLDKAEDRMERMHPVSFQKAEIQKQQREVQAFKNDVSLHSGEHEQTQQAGAALLAATDIDKEGVQDDLQLLGQRWEALNAALISRQQALDDVSSKVGEFQDRLRDMEHGLQRCEDRLTSHDAVGGGRDPRMLGRLKDLLQEADQLGQQLDRLRSTADQLRSDAHQLGSSADHVQDDVDRVDRRLRDLRDKLDDRHADLQSASHAVNEVNERLKGLSHELGLLEEELDNMAPVAREVIIVQKQVTEISVFLEKVVQERRHLDDADRTVEGLVKEGFASDAKTLRDQLGGMRRQLTRMDDRGKAREREVTVVLTKLTTFYTSYEVVVEDIRSASREEASFPPPATDVETIRRQQQQFREFKAERVETLTAHVDSCNRSGQSLVQSAAAGVNTSSLEGDLEKMNDLWNELKERIHNRERALDVGLLQSGKFREALEGLLQWLADTEDLVAHQKPPSADYKVVKAQVQEQRFLQKLLLDRQGSVSSLFDMGREIAKNCAPAERAEIEGQLRELTERFDALTGQAAERMQQLEDAMKVAKEYQDKNGPLVEWLEKMEKKLKDMETIPTDEDKIQRRIKDHDALHRDIVKRGGDFDELANIATVLMELVGDDEAAALADRLQEVTEQYTKLVDDSEALGRRLQDAGKQLRALVLNYEDFLVWMDEMEQRLNKYKVLSVHVDRLHEQMEELTDLSEEVDNHREPEQELQDIGADLMRHISSDEALQLKDKLDSISHRYSDLETKAAALLKNAQEVLPLVHAFHKAHTSLNDWLVDTEQTLLAVDTLPSPDETVEHLEQQVQEYKPVLDQVNQAGPQLCQISPGEGAQTIESLVTRDNRRFEAIVEQVQRKAERLRLTKQKNIEIVGDIDELLDWFREVETQIKEAEPPSSDPEVIRIQLKEHKALYDDVSSQKGRVRDVISTAKKLMRDAAQYDDVTEIREKVEDLKDTVDSVSKLSSDRLSSLEQALPLAEHFFETHLGISDWLDETEAEALRLDMPALRPDQVQRQLDRNKQLLQSIQDHRPLVDKLNKTGGALAKLCNDEEAQKVNDIIDTDNTRYNALRTSLRERQQALEEALQECSQFADKLDGMLSALKDTADQVDRAEPISAHPDRIHDQMAENNAIIDDLDKREVAFEAVKRAANDVISKAGDGDPAVKDIKKKLGNLTKLWDHLQKATDDRGRSLEDALAISERFWSELQGVMRALKDLQEALGNQEPPAIQPSAIKEQQKELQEIRQGIEQTKPEVEKVRRSGQDLMKVCGAPEKPEVKKNLADLDSAWDNITALYARREENLIDAMEKAMEFHDTLQYLVEFLEDAEERLEKLGPVGSDIDAVKKQIKQLMDFKGKVDPQMVKVEALNRSIRRQAQELMERTSPDQAAALKQPLADINTRWDELLKGIVERQRELDHALLRLGQFQHALDELLVWIGRTDKTLDGLRPVLGDPQVIEVELAKLKVTMNDIQAHQTSVDTLNDAGRQLIEDDRDSADASATHRKLNQLNDRWGELQDKATGKQRELENALRDAQDFMNEIQDLLFWLNDLDGALTTSKPVGGLPETAKEQLDRFMELYGELEHNRSKVEAVLQRGDTFLGKSKEGASTNLKHNLKTLKQRWEHVTNRANDKKIKLEIALKEATEFQEALQEFVDWLTGAEGVLGNLQPVSRVMDNIITQIDEHKDFQKEVSSHRETMLNLDKKGTQLKYFSQKQDVILIKNMLVSVQHRWERVVSKSADRTRALDVGYKEAKEFHDAWADLCGWMDDALKALDSADASMGNNPAKIRALLDKHREFQRALGGKQTAYDNVIKMGRALIKDKAPKTEEPIIRDMLNELKDKWNDCCNRSVARQRKLEEALLFSGQFKEALEALLDWLKKQQAGLDDTAPVHGDLDTVTALCEQHKSFEAQLKDREKQVESVQKTADELISKADKKDAAVIKTQVTELTTAWTQVVRSSDQRGRRLKDALRDAEELHKAVHMLLEWLSDAEMRLRFVGALPVGEEEAQQQVREHAKFQQELAAKEGEKDNTLRLAAEILEKAHPDAVPVIKHWQTIIESRWDEVSSWALQRQERLAEHLAGLKDLQQLLDELLQWVQQRERRMVELEPIPIPDELPVVEQLIQEHQAFMEDLQSRQADVDGICKPKHKPPMRKGSRAKSPTPAYMEFLRRPSQITPDREGIPGRRSRYSPDREISPSRGYARPWLNAARAGSPGRETTPESSWPRIGPVFPGGPYPPGSRRPSRQSISEPAPKNPQQRQLWDTWRNTWMLAWERQKRLQDKHNYAKELDSLRNFDFDEWRKRFMKYANSKKMRITDLFRRMDVDNDGFVTKEEFSEGIMRTHFPTSMMEMQLVADKVDRNSDGLIDYNEFMAALRPDWEKNRPLTEAEKIDDEVKKACSACNCRQKFKVFQVGEGKYRFGDSQKLRLVRILRSTVMVRVGGGWEALDEFLVKNDPCRAKGRTNVELREQFILAPGVSQSLAPFKSKAGSPSPRSVSVPTAGPITKVREKTGRSIPLSRASLSGPPMASGEQFGSQEGFRLRKGSTPLRSSQGGSRPASRAGSEASLDSVDGGRPSYRPGSGTPAHSGRQRKTSGTTTGRGSTAAHNGTSNGAEGTPSSAVGGRLSRTKAASQTNLSSPSAGAGAFGTPNGRGVAQPVLRLVKPGTSGSQIPVSMKRERSASKIQRRSSAASDTARGQARKPLWH